MMKSINKISWRLFWIMISLCGLSLIVFGGVGFAEPGIEITEPVDGSTVTPGQEITVTIESVDGFVLEDGFWGIPPFFDKELTVLPATFTVKIPVEVAGKVSIDAIGKDASGRFAGDEITLNVQQTAILQSLKVSPEDWEFETDWNGNVREDDGIEISVDGVYSDGVTRDITLAGTTYESNNPLVVAVDNKGRMKPYKLGEATITVSNSGVQMPLPVIVRKPRGLPRSETIPPTTQINIQPLPNEAGWHNSDITITLTATDNEGGSGVQEICYEFPYISAESQYVEGEQAVIYFSEEGINMFRYCAYDNERNSSGQQVTELRIDKTVPQLNLSVTPDILWPPNHKMFLITPTVAAADNYDPQPEVNLKLITMNEGDETNTYDPNYDASVGDGNTTDDIQIDENGNIYVRAERTGTGTGRVYTITYTATDIAGNSSTASATVTVPHDMD